MATALVLVAPGSEEIEVVTIVDVLRRGDVEITMAGFGSEQILGSHSIGIQVQTTIDAVRVADFEMLVLPGGQSAIRCLIEDAGILGSIKEMNDRGRYLAAIGAAPLLLAKANVLNEKKFTAHPKYHKELQENGLQVKMGVVCDGNITTAQGTGTAIPFALKLLKILVDESVARQVAGDLLVKYSAETEELSCS